MRLMAPAGRRNPQTGAAVSTRQTGWLRAMDVLAWSVWLGLAAGLLEVGTRVLCRAIDPTNRLYLMSRHFVWLTPLANMLLFFGLGLLLAGITKFWPRSGGWLSLRLLVRPGDAADVDAGVAGDFPRGLVRAAPWGSRHDWFPGSSRNRPKRATVVLVRSFSRSVGICPVAGGLRYLVETGSNSGAKRSRALPPAGSPNVLFIVLDTVRSRPPEPLWISASDHSQAGAAGQERNSIRSSARDRPVDAALTRQLLHGPLAP